MQLKTTNRGADLSRRNFLAGAAAVAAAPFLTSGVYSASGAAATTSEHGCDGEGTAKTRLTGSLQHRIWRARGDHLEVWLEHRSGDRKDCLDSTAIGSRVLVISGISREFGGIAPRPSADGHLASIVPFGSLWSRYRFLDSNIWKFASRRSLRSNTWCAAHGNSTRAFLAMPYRGREDIARTSVQR